jgi:hypothetical protein
VRRRLDATSRVRLRLLAATLAAVAALAALLPVSSLGGRAGRCTSLLGNAAYCGTAGQNLSVVGAFAAGGLLWWLTGSRRLPRVRRR